MKYKDIADIDFTKVVPNIVCSLCGAPVGSDDKFCCQCGRALTRKPGMIPVATMISVLDGYYGKHGDERKASVFVGDINPGSDSVSTKPTDDTCGSTFTAPRDWTAKMSEEQQPHCLHGDHRPESCGHCTKNGACDMTVLTSMPPQYDMCPYRGRGFIFCKDA